MGMGVGFPSLHRKKSVGAGVGKLSSDLVVSRVHLCPSLHYQPPWIFIGKKGVGLTRWDPVCKGLPEETLDPLSFTILLEIKRTSTLEESHNFVLKPSPLRRDTNSGGLVSCKRGYSYTTYTDKSELKGERFVHLRLRISCFGLFFG